MSGQSTSERPVGLPGRMNSVPWVPKWTRASARKRLLQPEIGGQVIVRRRPRLVVNQRGVVGLAAQGLRQQDHVAQVDAGNDDERFPLSCQTRNFPGGGPHRWMTACRCFSGTFASNQAWYCSAGTSTALPLAGQAVQDARGPDADLPAAIHQPARAARFRRPARARSRSLRCFSRCRTLTMLRGPFMNMPVAVPRINSDLPRSQS